MPIGAVLGGLGGLMNLLSPLFGKNQQPTNINPLTEQRLADLMQALGIRKEEFNQLGGEAASARNSQRGTASKAGNIAGKMENLQGPSPNAWFEQFLGNIPEYQAVASEVSRMSTEKFGRDIGEQTNLQMEQAMRAAGDATAGQGFSGAAASAAGQAAGSVLGESGLRQQEIAANSFNSTFNNLAGAGQGMAYQDQQAQFGNALQALSEALRGQQVSGSLFGQAGSQALQGQANVGGVMNTLQSGIQDITQPVYSSPTRVNPMAGAGNAIAGIGQFIEGGSWQDMFKKYMSESNTAQSNYNAGSGASGELFG